MPVGGGYAGAVAERPFVYVQENAMGSVLVAHGKNYYPNVEVVDSEGNRVTLFGCTFPTQQTALLTFLSPIAFTATFN